MNRAAQGKVTYDLVYGRDPDDCVIDPAGGAGGRHDDLDNRTKCGRRPVRQDAGGGCRFHLARADPDAVQVATPTCPLLDRVRRNGDAADLHDLLGRHLVGGSTRLSGGIRRDDRTGHGHSNMTVLGVALSMIVMAVFLNPMY